jgi:hypothetical protein
MPTVDLKQSAKREKELIAKLKGMTTPEFYFREPGTIVDVIEFLYQVAADYDDPEIPVMQRGLNFAVKNPQNLLPLEKRKPVNLPILPCGGGGPYCTLYATLTNLCAKVHARFSVRDNTIVIYPASETNSPTQKLFK